MLNFILKYTSSLVLFFALVFLTGATTTAGALADKAQSDYCCQTGTAEPAPPSDSECSDSNCLCLSCSVAVFFNIVLQSPFSGEALPNSPRGWHILSTPGRTIDYPPEHS